MRHASRALVLLFAAALAAPATAGSFAARLDRLEADLDQAAARLGLPVVPVQWGAPPPDADAAVRMNRLEGQMRQLNGSIEQLQNQVRVLTEQLRRFQQDTEFRFQEMQPQSRPGQPQRRGEAPATPGAAAAAAAPAPAPPSGGSEVIARAGPGAPPQPLGQVRASDAAGPLVLTPQVVPQGETVVASAGGAPIVATAPRAPAGPAQPAALPPAGSAREDYDQAYGHILRGDYEQAEATFQRFLRDHPGDRNTGAALYWLGESFYLRQQWRPAAEQFLRSATDHPQGAKAPESLLRLGMSLRQLGQKEPACATFAELLRRYPRASTAVRQRVQSEQRNAAC